MTKVQELAGLGQSIWLDYIRRAFLGCLRSYLKSSHLY
jgi:hypothetical protein